MESFYCYSTIMCSNHDGSTNQESLHENLQYFISGVHIIIMACQSMGISGSLPMANRIIQLYRSSNLIFSDKMITSWPNAESLYTPHTRTCTCTYTTDWWCMYMHVTYMCCSCHGSCIRNGMIIGREWTLSTRSEATQAATPNSKAP